jgi:hypothetical protein
MFIRPLQINSSADQSYFPTLPMGIINRDSVFIDKDDFFWSFGIKGETTSDKLT